MLVVEFIAKVVGIQVAFDAAKVVEFAINVVGPEEVVLNDGTRVVEFGTNVEGAKVVLKNGAFVEFATVEFNHGVEVTFMAPDAVLVSLNS